MPYKSKTFSTLIKRVRENALHLLRLALARERLASPDLSSPLAKKRDSVRRISRAVRLRRRTRDKAVRRLHRRCIALHLLRCVCRLCSPSAKTREMRRRRTKVREFAFFAFFAFGDAMHLRCKRREAKQGARNSKKN